MITVAWKLAQPEHRVLSSLAEELAAWVMIQEAKRHLEDETDEEGEDAFDAFIDAYFEDISSVCRYLLFLMPSRMLCKGEVVKEPRQNR